MTRLRTNFLYGQISDNPMPTAAIGASTPGNSSQFQSLPVVNAPDYVVVELDPKAVFGPPEIVYVIAHASGATTATLKRGQENTTPRSHSLNEVWISGPTSLDFTAVATPSVSNIGDTAFIGTSDAKALADHVHARETFATTQPTALQITVGGPGDDYNPAHHNHSHPVLGMMPTVSLPTDTGAVGGGESLAAHDHRHEREGFGIPLSSSPTDTALEGSGPETAAYDHQHGREGVGVPGSSAPGDSAAEGAGPEVVYFDHKHAREPLAAPTDSNYGDTAVTGPATSVASGGHRHRRIAPAIAFGQMDTQTPAWGGTSNAMATISGSGAPSTSPLITVPPSGILRFDFSFSGWQLATDAIDFYLGVGWTTGTRAGIWAGSSWGAVGHSSTPWDYVIVWAGLTDGTINTYSNVKTVSGSYTLGGMAGAAPNLRFYLLWGAVGGSMVCPAGSRGAAQYGTNLQVTTVP